MIAIVRIIRENHVSPRLFFFNLVRRKDELTMHVVSPRDASLGFDVVSRLHVADLNALSRISYQLTMSCFRDMRKHVREVTNIYEKRN